MSAYGSQCWQSIATCTFSDILLDTAMTPFGQCCTVSVSCMATAFGFVNLAMKPTTAKAPSLSMQARKVRCPMLSRAQSKRAQPIAAYHVAFAGRSIAQSHSRITTNSIRPDAMRKSLQLERIWFPALLIILIIANFILYKDLLQ